MTSVPRQEWQQRIGLARAGSHQGMFVEVEQDASSTGWHIWLSSRDPRLGPSRGWDCWADALEDVEEWIGPAGLDVGWIDGTEP